jgi:2-oxoglutarate dehydrogenase E2 component (dihydrolipoamide succinyltransferase)
MPRTSGERTHRREPMSSIRRTIAKNLVRSKHEAAHLTTFNEVDMTAASKMRKDFGEAFEKKYGVRLGYMSFFVKAVCQALQQFPLVNAMIDGTDIIHNDFFDIGIAVSTERGLVVPVLRDADQMSFAAIEYQIREYAGRARDKKLTPDEMSGGTFTITNGGVFGSLLSTPIPTPPQTAVLGMHTIQQRPVAIDGEVVIRSMMYLALTYDHRTIDGKEAVSFLSALKRLVESPETMLLDL